jgi:CheY-like chemotaxis protein
MLKHACNRRQFHVLLFATKMSQPRPIDDAKAPVKIFVVDDEPMLLDLAAAILQPYGFKVWTFRDPQLALEEFPAIKPEILVTDYAMGSMNGMDLVVQCRRLNPKQKIILLSGTVDEGVYADVPDKPDRFLAKPYQVHQFVELIRTLATS